MRTTVLPHLAHLACSSVDSEFPAQANVFCDQGGRKQ